MPSRRLYRVKDGYTHGRRNEYTAGHTVELTEHEAAGFLDKLERIEAPAADDASVAERLAECTVNEVLALVDAGEVSPADALAHEHAGKNRVTLTRQLEDILDG